MSSTDNNAETRIICGREIRIIHSVEIKKCYGKGEFITYYWEGAEIAIIPKCAVCREGLDAA